MTELEQAARQALEALDAMLTHMGMDEDEWTKPTFDQARVAITALKNALKELEDADKRKSEQSV